MLSQNQSLLESSPRREIPSVLSRSQRKASRTTTGTKIAGQNGRPAQWSPSSRVDTRRFWSVTSTRKTWNGQQSGLHAISRSNHWWRAPPELATQAWKIIHHSYSFLSITGVSYTLRGRWWCCKGMRWALKVASWIAMFGCWWCGDDSRVRIVGLPRGIPTGMVCPTISLEWTILWFLNFRPPQWDFSCGQASLRHILETCWARDSACY